MNMKIYGEIREAIDAIEGVDTHEHIRRIEALRKEGQSIYTSFKHSILDFDFVVAGMQSSFWRGGSYSGDNAKSMDPDLAWAEIRKYIDRVRNTTFYRTLLVTYKDLLGFDHDEITDSNWKELSDSITRAYARDDWYEEVIRRRLKKAVVFIDIFWDPWSFELDRRYFLPVQRFEPLLFVKSKKFLKALSIDAVTADDVAAKIGENAGKCKTLDDYEGLLDKAFKRAVEQKSPCIKVAVSYNRGLYFANVDKSAAAKIFKKSDDDVTAEEAKTMEDYIFHRIVDKATEAGLPVQLHTGIQGGVTSKLRNADPLDLNEAFFQHPDAKFILFHMSVPYSTEAALLAKTFPNVYLDLCWMSYYLYGSSFNQRLKEWITIVPINKIMAGGDCENVERMYASNVVLNKQLAEVLTDCVEYGLYNKELAVSIAKRILRDNAIETCLGVKV